MNNQHVGYVPWKQFDEMLQRAQCAEEQLATATQRNTELAETLHRRNSKIAEQAQQLAAAEQALALATGSTPGHGTGVWVPLERWQEMHAQLAAVPEHDIIMIYNACPLNTATQSSIMRVRDWLQARA